MKISKNLDSSLDKIKDTLSSSDVEFCNIRINKTSACLIFIKDIVDKQLIGELIIKPLHTYKKEINFNQLFSLFLNPEKQKILDLNEVITAVVAGKTLLLIDGLDCAIAFDVLKFEKRSIQEPPTSTVIKGPREGFVESLNVNVSMIRRRLKTPALTFENFTIGRYSKTTVCLCYVKGISQKDLVKKLREKLKKIKIDALLDSSYISKEIADSKSSLFKQLGNTEKPDILVSKILEGRVAIIVDGSPIVLTAPYLLLEDFQSASDYYTSSYSATLSRMVRIFSVIISIFLPAMFVSAELFHVQLIPLSFLLTIVNSVKGIPLSPSYEMFFTLVIFETLNEASVRMPKYVGMVVSIVGGLVLGETAINAGIISAPTLMIIAFSGVCLFTVPELEHTFSILRLIFLIIGGSIGGFGLIIASVFMVIYLVSYESFDIPILAPFVPLVPSDLKDSFYKSFLADSSYRPLSLHPKNKKRIKENSK